MRAQLAATLGARLRQLVLRLVEVPLGVAAGEADGGPVAEDLPALLAQPVRGLAHGPTVAHDERRRWPTQPIVSAVSSKKGILNGDRA